MNNLLRIFDNVAFNFAIVDDFITATSIIQNYKLLNNDHLGYHVPYIARNSGNQSYETGIGEVISHNNKIVIKRIKTLSSSNNGENVNFSGDQNEFFIFANQEFFDKALSNVVVINNDQTIDPVSALYLIEPNNNTALTLPTINKSQGIILEFKVIHSEQNYDVVIKSFDGEVIKILNNNYDYVKLTIYNNTWIEISHDQEQQYTSLSTGNFSAFSDPADDNNSLQYKVNSTTFGGTKVYWSPSSGLLFGSASTDTAKNIIASSGNSSSIFNASNDASDFIIYGSGNKNKNFFFAYDGRIGLNIPTGTRPLTLMHIVNTGCQQGIRLENRASCVPANITLFHKPVSNIVANSTISQISLTSKNSEGNEIYYARIQARALEPTANLEKGSLEIILASGSSYLKTFDTSTDNTEVGYSSQKINISNNANISITNKDSSIVLSPSTITITGSSVAINSPIVSTTGIINAKIQSDQVTLSTVAPSSILTVDSNRKIIGSNCLVTNDGLIKLPIADNKILTTTNSGVITGIYNIDDYFLTKNDITWNTFSPIQAAVCLRQVTFSSPVNSEEFSANDQVVINISGINYYRNIDQLTVNGGNQITEMLLDTAMPFSDTNDITIQSITKGGYLNLSRYTDNELSDSTSNILSIRPNLNTSFNTSKKDTNFEVYGLNNEPAIFVKASGSTIGINTSSAYTIPSGRNVIFNQPNEIPASLTVSGWLYSNNIMVGSSDSTAPSLVSPGIIESSGIRAKTIQYINLEQIDDSGNILSSTTSSIINNKAVTTFEQGFRAYANTGDPGLYFYPKINNALSGSVYSGVFFSTFLDRAKSTASGWSYDTKSRTTINTDTPYVVGSLATGTYEINNITVTGYGYLYSDLTINGIAYASEIISEDIYLRPTPSINNTGKYIANAFLTLDRNGKIVSHIPTSNHTVPTAPQNLAVTQGNGIGNGEVSLIWTAPQNNGGTPILTYILEFSLDGGSTWTRLPVGNYILNRALANSTHCSVLGLSSLNTYKFRVAAQNNVGVGPFSSNSASITPASSAPKAVNNITYTRTFNENNTSSIALSWSASDAGGSPIIGYTIQESTDKGLTWQDYNNTSNLITNTFETIYGTNSSLDYYYRISAWNDYNDLNNQSAFAYSYVSGNNPGAPFDTIDSSLSNWDFGIVLFTGVC
jgi:hypothetical protein